MENKDLIVKSVDEVLSILDSMYDDKKVKQDCIKYAAEINNMYDILSDLQRVLNRDKVKIDFCLPYKNTLKNLYGDKPLPYRLSRKYNDTDLISCIDLAFSIINKFNPNAEEVMYINENEYNSVIVLEFLITWLTDYFGVKSYELLGGHVTFEEVEEVMRKTNWGELITDSI